MDIIFQHLYNETYGYLQEKEYSNYITFPQNFIPVPGLKYTNLQIKETPTGRFIFNGKTYSVRRAYHPDYDLKGNSIGKTANIIEIIDFKYKNKDNAVKMNNEFTKLSKIRSQLPNQ